MAAVHVEVWDLTKNRERLLARLVEGGPAVPLGRAEAGGDAAPHAATLRVAPGGAVEVTRAGSSVVRVRERPGAIPVILQAEGGAATLADPSDAAVSLASGKWLHLRRRVVRVGPPPPRPLDGTLVVLPPLGAAGTGAQAAAWARDRKSVV